MTSTRVAPASPRLDHLTRVATRKRARPGSYLEVGWTLARDAWRQGYATEAASTAIEWAWTVLHAPRLISVIDPENLASARVAERVGMRRLREETLQNEGPLDGLTVVIFGIEHPGPGSAPGASPRV